MSNPGKYRITDLIIVQELIQAYPLGVITSNGEGYPMGSSAMQKPSGKWVPASRISGMFHLPAFNTKAGRRLQAKAG